MTGPIKPPGSTPPSPEIVKPQTTTGPGETRFREVLDAREPEATRGAQTVKDPVVAALESGQLDAKGAVDALVARALDSDVARGLTPAGRVALEQHLRTQLAEDPAFQRLIKDLG